MVVHKFQPNIAASLFNYKDWSIAPSPLPSQDDSQVCPCHKQVLPGAALVEGHVCDTDVLKPAAPYLRDIPTKGRKFRLEQPLASILPRLEEGLQQYMDYKMRSKQGDWAFQAQLERWAEAIMARARHKVVQGAMAAKPLPDGQPGLLNQLNKAKAALMFGPEDRAPHAIAFVCGRWYLPKLQERLC